MIKTNGEGKCCIFPKHCMRDWLYNKTNVIICGGRKHLYCQVFFAYYKAYVLAHKWKTTLKKRSSTILYKNRSPSTQWLLHHASD